MAPSAGDGGNDGNGERLLPATYLNAAHELRSPLARLLHQVDSLQDPANGSLSPTQAGIAQNISSTCLRMQRLVEDCFSYGRMVSGKVFLTAQQTDLPELFQELASAWEPAFSRKGVRLSVAPSTALLTFVCDPYKLLRIVSVLIENALKFTPAGGQVDLSWDRCLWHEEGSETEALDVEAGQRPRLTTEESSVPVPPGAYSLLVTVKDTGCGIPEQGQTEIFKPFVRLHRHGIPLETGPQPGTARYQRRREDQTTGLGLGLGLAVAWRLVQLHGGRIWVDSEPERGSTFTIVLPPGIEACNALAN
ncbi:MAG TPA: HAMP domain-containing sensor histidine kinase [Terriglobales bacterium]|nr:HAMP domain-containing sensor histidine kinase [Terriglobales bacterium]